MRTWLKRTIGVHMTNGLIQNCINMTQDWQLNNKSSASILFARNDPNNENKVMEWLKKQTNTFLSITKSQHDQLKMNYEKHSNGMNTNSKQKLWLLTDSTTF
jgi:hypothetical protein